MKSSGPTGRIVLGVAVCAAALAAVPGQAQEQRLEPPAGRTTAAAGGQEQQQARRWNRQQIRDRLVERYQRALELDGAAWEALRADVDKVVDLSLQLRAGAWMGGRRNQAAVAAPVSAVETCLQELRDALTDREAAPDRIQEKLAALRAAQAAAGEEFAKAQAALEAKLTPRQQGMLLLRGMLE